MRSKIIEPQQKFNGSSLKKVYGKRKKNFFTTKVNTMGSGISYESRLKKSFFSFKIKNKHNACYYIAYSISFIFIAYSLFI